jgi:hypothetical protein
MENDIAFKNLLVVKSVLDRHKVPFFLAYGTLLGAYRDKDFLPGDDDIDLGVISPIDLRTRKSIGWMLYDLGFKPQEIMFNVFGRMEAAEIGYNGDDKTGIIVCQKDDTKLTIFFYKHDECDEHGNVMLCIPKLGAMNLIESPIEFYGKLGTIKFKGETFGSPSPIEDYLAFTYEDWKDPMKRDHGKIYSEAHPKYLEYIKDVAKNNQVVLWKK